MAGLIKATLALQHGEIPRQVHFTTLNPHLSLAGTCLAVADAHRPWPADRHPRVAGVSGFGVGGTNAHVLVEEAPDPGRRRAAGDDDEPQLLALSAQSPTPLRELASRGSTCSTPRPSRCRPALPPPARAARTTTTASRWSARAPAQIADLLAGFVTGDPAPTVALGTPPARWLARVGFVFSGQGAQWASMGRELARARAGVPRRAGRRRRPLPTPRRVVGRRRRSPSRTATSRLQDTEVAQPAIFAVQVALAALWESWGVRPDAVVGHSIGELAALHVAGVLSLDDAVRIVWHRGRIMQRATGLGRMTAVGLTPERPRRSIAETRRELSLAAVNAPRSVVLSGTTAAVERRRGRARQRGVSRRELPVTYAFHSAQMAPFERELVDAIGSASTTARADATCTRP